MKAIRIHQFGFTEDVLQYEDVPVPERKAGRVLIKVSAASLNRTDLGLHKGHLFVFLPMPCRLVKVAACDALC